MKIRTGLLSLFLLAAVFADPYTESTFLFCLNPDVDPLQISRSGDDILIDNQELSRFFADNGIVDIERWIPAAEAHDHDGDIYLNRIYRAYVDTGHRSSLVDIKENIAHFSFVHSSEFEKVQIPTYTPNDPAFFNQQDGLPAVKADLAWDFWDIDGGEIPGDRSILLASVDTAVDITHPDLVPNIWINQDEVPGALVEIVDTNGDNYVSSIEIIDFMIQEDLDENNDGVINLLDALESSSPFTDGIDNDNWDNNSNTFKDDLVGWDLSGWSGTDDNNPMPREDTANNSTWAHGTHVAGILGAATNNNLGIASVVFKGSILSVKCSRENQIEPGVNDGYSGITYAAKVGNDKGTHTIINCSWGNTSYNSYEQSVVNNAFNTYGAVVVGAAGNGNDFGAEEYSTHYPSSYNNCVSVAAIGANGVWGHWATYHETVDLSAPGEDVYSTIINGGYESWNGSSMASPFAASCIGLLYSFYPGWTNDQLVDRIIEAADPFIYELNTEDYLQGRLGVGMVDAYTAIGALVFPGLYYYNHTLILSDDNDDSVLNPGESADLRVTLGNIDGWQNAENVVVTLISDNPNVIITDNQAVYGDINNGGIAVNLDDLFSFELADEVALGEVELILQATADSATGDEYSVNIPFNITVSLNQDGWPVTALTEDLINVEIAPLVMDVMGGAGKEIVFADYSGYIYALNSDGTLIEDGLFPFDTGNQVWGSPAAADIDGDGNIEIISTSKSKHLYILDPADNSLQADYSSGQFLMGSPALGNIDDDDDLEVIMGGYNSSGKIFAVNPDGSDVEGFPYELGEKMLRGIAVADFDGNDKVDIVCVTETHHIWLIYDDGTIADGFPFVADDKFKSAPSILEIGGQKVIFAGCNDDKMYAVNADGSLRFEVLTGDDVLTTASMVTVDGEITVLFGSNDGYIYAVDGMGVDREGWPLYTGISVKSSPVIADLNGDGEPEVIVGSGLGGVLVYEMDGGSYPHFPIESLPAVNGTATVADTDGDGDLEILIGTVSSLESLDVKQAGSVDGFWSTHRGSELRTGYSGDVGTDSGCSGCTPGDVNCDGTMDILDIVTTVNIIIDGPSEFTECEVYLADINQDTIIDILDIVTLVNEIIGN